MTLQRSGGAAAFSVSAEAYAATMAPSLRPVAARVVAAARLRPGERVVDLGTGTGIGAAAAVGDGREVVGVDAAAGMLALARRDVPDATFVEADFGELPFADARFDVALAVHALLFATDRVATLAAWRRVVRAGGRLSLSVPGPFEAVMMHLYEGIYDRYDLPWGRDYPTEAELAGWAAAAGWGEIATEADRNVAIRLADEAAFDTWLRVGSRGQLTAAWSAERRAAFRGDLLAATPREGDGRLRLPFGALFLTARR